MRARGSLTGRLSCPVILAWLAWACLGCGTSTETATVVSVIDGDTVDLSDGRRVRYLMIDTPEITGGKDECYGQEARTFNQSLVDGQQVELSYDVERLDQYGRTLAYVEVQGREVNLLMIERGFARVLYIPPNGEDRYGEFSAVESDAKNQCRGMWGECEAVCE